MQKTEKPRFVAFPNQFAGKPIKKKDGSLIMNFKGEPMLNPDLQGKISLPEGLPAGEYEVGIYKAISKAGKEYYSGTIKKAWVKQEKPISQHSQDKANGYQSGLDDDSFEF